MCYMKSKFLLKIDLQAVMLPLAPTEASKVLHMLPSDLECATYAAHQLKLIEKIWWKIRATELCTPLKSYLKWPFPWIFVVMFHFHLCPQWTVVSLPAFPVAPGQKKMKEYQSGMAQPQYSRNCQVIWFKPPWHKCPHTVSSPLTISIT